MKNRLVTVSVAVTTLFLLLMMKIININMSMISQAARSQQTKTVEIGSSRGKIYDRNLRLITDRENRLIAAVTPSPSAAELPAVSLSKEELLEKIESGKPFSLELKEEVNTELVRTFSVPVRYSGSFACHITGYLDKAETNGLSGVEKAYNTYLKENGGKLSVKFEVDAHGRALAGLDKTVVDNNFSSKAGVVLTIDSVIQEITEAALEKSKIRSGAAIVMHIDTGEIYSLASIPVFNRNDVSENLSEDNSPLVNKALQSYSVGSVFKPLVAACALENAISESLVYNCKGKIKVGDTVFRCFEGTAHKKINMTEALEKSCNCYFINLMEKIDRDYLLYICRLLGIESETEIAENICGTKGVLPSNDNLASAGERANLSFGQGRLLMSPLHVLSVYHALATGNAVTPTIFYGYANSNGLVKTKENAVATKVFSDNTVLKMRKMLSSVVENGNASNAKSEILSLAGKTGTAQSGIFEKGKEICRTWFAGFYPSDNPHYIVVVLCENGSGGNTDCAGVFREICEEIALKK
ncbi:MAG: penicillin-binding protein 2 [Clostridia bacterium]|nr:penicillin-binding protein 2 [Clostridia bacterium]